MSVEVRPVSGFRAVVFRGPGTLKITQGERESVKIHAPGYVMNDIEARVQDDTLHLGYVPPRVVRLRVWGEVISYDLVLKDLRRLSVRGSGKVIAPDIDVDALGVRLDGSARVHLQHLTADHFSLVLAGSGLVTIAGDVESQSLSITGSGRCQGEHLVSDFADVRISGSGSADVNASDELNVNVSGSGVVSYSGQPEVTKQVSGSGKVVRRRRQKRESPRGEEHG